MRLSAALGGLGNPGLARIDAADAVFDVSGGDSFADIYGVERFRTVAWPKRLAVLRRRPLVLLPQTYGPFRSPRLRASGRDDPGAAMAWARDDNSYQAIWSCSATPSTRRGTALGSTWRSRWNPGDPAGTSATSSRGGSPPRRAGRRYQRQRAADAPRRRRRLRAAADEGAVMLRLRRRLIAQSDARLLIVPHVLAPGPVDDDVAAARRLADDVGAAVPIGCSGCPRARPASDQVGDLAYELVLRGPHALDDRRALLGGALGGSGLQRQGARGLREVGQQPRVADARLARRRRGRHPVVGSDRERRPPWNSPRGSAMLRRAGGRWTRLSPVYGVRRLPGRLRREVS